MKTYTIETSDAPYWQFEIVEHETGTEDRTIAKCMTESDAKLVITALSTSKLGEPVWDEKGEQK